MLVEMRNRFPHCSKNIEQYLRKLISKPSRKQFMNICFQHSLMHDYNWKEKENLEEVIAGVDPVISAQTGFNFSRNFATGCNRVNPCEIKSDLNRIYANRMFDLNRA